MMGRLRVSSWLAISTFLTLACAPAPRWQATRRPDALDARSLLANDNLALARDERPGEMAKVPERKRLRPCCAFGTGLKLRVGWVGIPGFAIGNIASAESIGRHRYDAGRRGTELIVGSEKNALVYTCRGGFIDTAHVRDYADWTLFLATEFARLVETGGVLELSDSEGGRRRFVLEPIDRDLVAVIGRRNLTASMAAWAGFQLSVWHEIVTWTGWASYDLFSERASAFSPEDLYSNLLGAKLAAAIITEGNDLSENLFNQAVDDWLAQSLSFLGAVSSEEGEEAMRSVDGIWWDSKARLPDDQLVLRRNIQYGPMIEPWVVKKAANEGLESCPADPEPHPLRNPRRIPLVDFANVIRFEVMLDDERRAHPVLSGFGEGVSHEDFPAILDRVRREAADEFGVLADRPDR